MFRISHQSSVPYFPIYIQTFINFNWVKKVAKLSVDQALLKAKSHAKKGETQEAQKLYQLVLQAFPKNKPAQRELAALSRPKHSIDLPDPPQETINQLFSLYNQGQMAAVIEQAAPLTAQYPRAFVVWNIVGAANKGLNQIADAYKAFTKVTELNPNYADGFYNLGIILQDQGRLDEAITSYKKALALKPDYAEAHNNMGNTLKEQGQLDEAIASYEQALSIKPDYADAFYNIGNVLKDQGKLEDAIASYERALSLKPDQPEMYNNLGTALQDQGKLDEAIDAYNRALTINPDHAVTHRNLSFLIKYESNHPQIATVNKMMKRVDLTNDDRCNLHYAFAKMNEDIGKLDVAFENYVAGGRLRQKLLAYDFKQDELAFHQIKTAALKVKDTFFSKPVEALPHTPIFILGMPRSGTTLVEQIISRHSQVHGAGELRYFGGLATPLNLGNRIINPDSILQVRNAYLNELGKVSNGSPLVTDKMPNNFLHIGLILKAIPEAKIIHVKRDPAATCWSNFKHYFSSNRLGYSYDLEDTVGYFKLYQDLMRFWSQEQNGQIFHLDYEKLTVEQESETRKLIEHMQLGWEDACLSPQENKRSVRTASQQQVRKNVYTGSSNAWRKFEPYLQGVFDQLET